MKRTAGTAFASVAALFFVWGFVSANNDPLLLALKQIYALTWVEALLTHSMFAIAFGVVSVPAATVAGRIGLERLIPVALSTMAAGCAVVAGATGQLSYGVVLGGLFIIASGIVALQVAANPLAAALGPAGQSHWRLNLAQSLNSLGVVVGANSGAAVLLKSSGEALSPGGVRTAYGAMGVGLLILAWWTAVSGPKLSTSAPAPPVPVSPLAALRSRWAVAGAIALGLYVGAEVTLSSLMAAFLSQPTIFGSSLREGGAMLANFYWGGALVGRLAGIVLLRRIAAAHLLASCAVGAVLLCLVAMIATGPVAGAAALAVGLMNSIMFPVIFSITLERAGLPAAAVSGLLCAAIVGGALLPLAAGHLADLSGVAAALVLPMLAYGLILTFAWRAAQAGKTG